MSNATEPCPKCGHIHTVGEYFIQREGEKRVYAPNDIKCECGLELRWSVPIFKTTASGYTLGVKKDSEPFRNSSEKAK